MVLALTLPIHMGGQCLELKWGNMITTEQAIESSRNAPDDDTGIMLDSI